MIHADMIKAGKLAEEHSILIEKHDYQVTVAMNFDKRWQTFGDIFAVRDDADYFAIKAFYQECLYGFTGLPHSRIALIL